MAESGDNKPGNTSPAPAAAQAPPPRRLWWTKRLALAYVVFAAALVISHIAWQREAERRLAAAVAPFTAAGYNLDWRTNAPEPIPDSRNAAAIYLQAASQLALTARQDVLVSYLSGGQALQDRYAAETDELIAANAAVLALCRQARGLKAYWGVPHTSPAFATISSFLPNFSKQRHLMRFLCVAAGRQASSGQSDEAVQTLLDARALTLASGEDSGLLGHLVALACWSMETKAIEQTAPRLTGNGIRQLATALLNDESGKTYRRMLGVETAAFLDGFAYFSGSVKSQVPGLGAPGPSWLLRPALTADAALVVAKNWSFAMTGDRHDLSWQKTWTSAFSAVSFFPPSRPQGLRMVAHWQSAILAPSLWRVQEFQCQTLARQRLAAVRLALRLFELEQKRPARALGELVPDYLPAVPIDPLDPNGGPIRALLGDPVPRIYSLGNNGIDDGGNAAGQLDEVLYLNPADRPAVNPAQAVAEIEAAASQPGAEDNSPAASEPAPADAAAGKE